MTRKRTWLVACTLAMSPTVLWAAPAHAAMCIQWKPVPVHGVGDAVSVTFETFGPLPAGTLTPVAVEYPFRVEATAPDGSVVPVAVAHGDGPGRFAWHGQFVATKVGIWRVRSLNFGADTPCGPELRIAVSDTAHILEAAAPSPPLSLPVARLPKRPPALPVGGQSSAPIVAGAAVGTVALALAMVWLRHRKRTH